MADQGSRNRILTTAIALAAALPLLYLGVPRTIAGFQEVSGNVALRNVRRGREVDLAALNRLAESRRNALEWRQRGRDWTDLGLAQLLIAHRTEADDAGRAAYVSAAAASLESGLRLAPLNPQAWTRLAYARWLDRGPSSDLRTPLLMSIYTGPHEPELVFVRLKLIYSVWETFSAKERATVQRQIRFAWKTGKSRLVEMAYAVGRIRETRLALVSSPLELAKFERRLRRYLRQQPRPGD